MQAFIFDIDGTLVDSVDLHARAWVDAFADYGHQVPFQAVRDQIGKGGDQLLPVFLSSREIEARGKALEQHRSRLFKERYLAEVRAFPAVRALFRRILDDGKRVALASSAKEDELEAYKRIAGIEDLVEAQTSSDDADKSKPHPDIFDAAIRRLGELPPGEILVIGDTPYDAEAAAKAGLRTVGVTCGGWSADALTRAGCIAVHPNPAALLAHYDAIARL